MKIKIDNKITWTHWFEPPMIPGYAERCVILEKRNGFFGWLFGNVKILTNHNYCGWEFEKDLFKPHNF